jgi:DNA-binding NtrC family response regulator
MPPESLPSYPILLIDPDAELLKILAHSVPQSTVDVYGSLEEALPHVPLTAYQLLICPYRMALFNKHTLLAVSRLHNPFAPFVVTMHKGEFSFVEHAIDYGVLGVLDAAHTTQDVLRTVRPLLWLYQLRHSLGRRAQWLIDFRAQIRNNPVQEKWQPVIDNRLLCEQALVAIEDGMQTLRMHADDLMADAKERMRYSSQQDRDVQT